MTRAKYFSLLALTFFLLLAPVAAQQKEYTIEQFMNTVRIGGSSFSADEKSILFHSNKSGIFNVYSVPVTGGGATQMTNSTKESTYAVSYFPADARFLYRYDKGGNENEHLYLRELDGTERDLCVGVESVGVLCGPRMAGRPQEGQHGHHRKRERQEAAPGFSPNPRHPVLHVPA